MVVDRIKLWLSFLNPSDTDRILKQYKGKGTLKEALINIVLSSLVPAGAMLIIFVLIGLFLGAVFGGLASLGDAGGLMAGAGFGVGTIIIGIIYAVIVVIMTPIVWFIVHGIYWVLAKLLGGTGSYIEQFYFGSFVVGATNILMPLYFIPCVGMLASMVVSLYTYFLIYKIVKSVHGLSTGRAAAVVLIPIVLVIMFYILVIAASALS